mgnify:CR=1 FL=1
MIILNKLNFFNYLQGENFKKSDMDSFLKSSLKTSIDHQIEELDMYLLGGPTANDLREAYSWMGKPRARKVKEYLEKEYRCYNFSQKSIYR